MITRSDSFTVIANRLSSNPVLDARHFGDTSATIAPTGTSQCFSVFVRFACMRMKIKRNTHTYRRQDDAEIK